MGSQVRMHNWEDRTRLRTIESLGLHRKLKIENSDVLWDLCGKETM